MSTRPPSLRITTAPSLLWGVLLSVGLLFGAVGASHGQTFDAPWQGFAAGANNASLSPFGATSSTFQASIGDIIAPSAVGADGDVYVKYESGGNVNLYRIVPDGGAGTAQVADFGPAAANATEEDGTARAIGPVIGAEGRVYVVAPGGESRALYRVDTQSGDAVTQIFAPSEATFAGEPAIDPATQNLYVPLTDNRIVVLQPDGSVVVSYTTLTETTPTAPLIDRNGRVIYSTAGGTVEAIDEGTQIGLFDVTSAGGVVQPLSPVAFQEGIVYVTSRAPNNENPKTLYSIDAADGSVRWQHELQTADDDVSAPVVDGKGNVYVTTRDEISVDGSVWAFTAEAADPKDPLWRVGSNMIPSMPALSPRGRVLVGIETQSGNGELRSYDPSSGSINWTEVIPNENVPKRYAPTILSDGAAVVGTSSAAYIVLGAIPDVSLSSISFGGVEAGATYSRSVTFENKGGSPFTFLSASATSPSGEYQVVTAPPDGSEFSPSQTSEIAVDFTPAPNPSVPSESRDGTLTIRTSVGDLTVPLNALVNSPQLTATPDPIDFGTFDSQGTDTRDVVLQNTGTANLTISSRTISGPNSDLFSLTSSADGTLQPSDTFTYTVEYNPNGATGTHTADLELTTAELGTILIPITALGQLQEFTATPTSLFDAANVDVGASVSETVTLEAPESSDVQVDQLVIAPDPNAGTDYSGDYAVTSTGNTGQINSNDTKDVIVEFSPSGGGARPAILQVQTESRGVLEIPLRGTGLTYVLSPTPTSVDFGSFAVGETDDPETVTIENTGTGPITNLSASLDNTTDFSISSAPATSLNPGETTTVELTFTPQSTGAKTATLTLSSDNADAQSVAVTGDGDDREITMTSDFTYATTEVGQTTSKDLVVENTGSVTLNNLTVSFGSSSEFAVTNVNTTSIAPGEQATISTTFTPGGDGTRTATLQVSADDSILSLILGPYTTTFSASGEGVTYALSSSGDLTFGDVAVSATSGGQDVTFTNTGSGTLTGLSVNLADGTHYTITGDTGGPTLAPGETRTVTVAFAPTSSGAQSTTLTLSAAEGASASAALDGFGADYAVTASPTANDFGTVETGTQGGTQTFTFTNASNTSVSGVSVSLDNTTDFTITNDTGEATLEAGATRDVTVQFAPQTAGSLSAALDVTTNEGASASATLDGFGGTYTLTTAPTSVDFGGVKVGETAPQTVTIENTGNDAVDLTGIGISGADAGRFTITSGGELNTLAAGATQDVTIEYAPDAANGDAASLDVTGSNGTSATTSLSGSGQKGTISISPSPVSFPETEVGQTSAAEAVTIENTGGASLSGVSVTLTNTADFTITDDTGETDLAPGATRTVSVAFSPGTEGALSGALETTSTEGISENTTLSGTGLTFSIAPSTTALDFGGVAVGSSAQQTVSIENTGSGDVTLTGFEISGADAAQFAIASGAESVTLTPGATQSVTVSYTPDAANADAATLSVTGSDGTSADVSLSGSGQDGDLTVSTTSVDFGTVEVGQTSATQDVTFTNSGNGDLENVAVSLSNTTDYAITNDTGAPTLGPSQSRTVTVQFAPSTTGSTSATLQATADGGESLSASLSGFGATYSLATTPGSVDFGGVKIGTTVTQTVTIENTGNDAVDLTGIQLSGADASAFDLTSGTGLNTLAPGATQDVTVAYTPPGTSSDAATLEVTGSNGTAASTSLSGSGTEGALSASVSSLSFGSVEVGQTSTSQDVTLTNTGSVSVSGVAVNLTNTTNFTITGDTGETTLAPSERRTVSVAFAPSASGSLSTTLVASTSEGTAASVSLSGTGTTTGLTASTTTLDFGSIPIGTTATQTVTLENTGTVDLTLDAAQISGADASVFGIESGGGAQLLAPGATQDVTVRYTPSGTSTDAATLSVTSSEGPSVSVDLSGSGEEGALSASPSSVDFETVNVGTTSAGQEVTFTNTGNAPVEGVSLSLSSTSDFSITNDTGETTLPSGASRTVTVAAAPSEGGDKTATLQASSANTVSASTSLSVFGAAPELTTTASLDFGDVPLGSSAAQSITIQNTGNVPVGDVTATVQGENAASFTVTSGSGPDSLATGAETSVTIEFAPSAVATETATLSIASATAATIEVTLTGTGAPVPEGAFATSNVDFGTLATQTSATKTVDLTSTGSAPLTVNALSLSGPDAARFEIVTTDVGPIASGETASLRVRFTPNAEGDASATLTADTDAGALTTSLTGTGVAVTLTVGAAQAGDPLPVSVAAPGFFDASGSYSLFVRPGGATTYTRLPLTGAADEVTASVPDTLVTVRGLDYYVVLENGAQSLALPKADAEASASQPAHQRVRFDAVTADGPFAAEAYRMISVPVQPDEAAVRGQLADDYGEYAPTEWRLVQWDASAQRYRDVEASDSLGAGAATWLVTKDGTPFTVGDGRSVAPDSVTVTLQPGWNQVATPFAFPVRWADVVGRESVEAPVGFEDGAFQFGATTLKPWRGYFVFNPGADAVDLTIPPVAAGSDAASESETSPAMVASKASTTKASGDAPYTLQLSAHLDRLGLRDANNYVGFRPDASEGRDATDYADPPAVGSHVRLSVTENGATLAGSFRPTGTTGQAWDVAVSASVDESFQTDKTVRVTLRNVTGTLPSGYDRYVLDLDRERYVPTNGGTFTAKLTPERTTRRFRVVLGTDAFAQQASDGIPLRSYENSLTPNAPNPFTNETTLGYTLSEKRDVTIEIYNILGQRIRTMDLGEKSAGPHEVTWDGRTRYGQLAASGVYFYRIRAGDFVASKKMTLVR